MRVYSSSDVQPVSDYPHMYVAPTTAFLEIFQVAPGVLSVVPFYNQFYNQMKNSSEKNIKDRKHWGKILRS